MSFHLRTQDHNVPILDVQIKNDGIRVDLVLRNFVDLFQTIEDKDELLDDFDHLLRLEEFFGFQDEYDRHNFIGRHMTQVADKWELKLEVFE